MRVCFFYPFMVMFGTQLLIANPSDGQTLDRIDVTVEMRGDNLETLFKKIEKQTNLMFAYQPQQVEGIVNITLQKQKRSVKSTLDLGLEGTHLRYRQVNNNVIIFFEDTPLRQSLEIETPAKIVRGVVRDASGTPLSSVNIVVKGTTVGTNTDAEGRYSINVVDDNAVLIFSFIGYMSQEVAVSTRSVIDVSMVEDIRNLDAAVVVGYGTQKKVNLTGSVATVSSKELLMRPLTNVENLLQGKVAGLQVIQNSGQPGNETNTMRIRGLGTFSSAGSGPLVLINGVQGDMTTLDPANIESISVLKDAASCAIYGARAANGVVLVTTKQGKEGKARITYNGNYQLHQATRQPDFVTNSADYMEMFNSARTRAGLPMIFSQGEIDTYRNATDRVKYPNYDWVDATIHNAYAQNQHLSVSGGTKSTTYNFSLGYFSQDGVIDMHRLKKYNAMLDLKTKINERISAGVNVGLNYRDVVAATYPETDMILLVYGAAPLYGPYLSDGSGRVAFSYNESLGSNLNPLSVVQGSGNGKQIFKKANATFQTFVDVKILRDLTWKTLGSINYDNNWDKLREFPVDNYYFSDNSYAHDGWPWHLGVTERNYNNLLTTLFSTLNYKNSIGSHNLNVLVGYNQESNINRYLYGNRQQFPTNGLTDLRAGAAIGQRTDGLTTEWAIRSFFGRLNYNFDEKYLLEANFRYDGTSRIHKNNRWGLFPAISAGWRISREDFLSDVNWIDDLKLRASWGKLGNQNIGFYPFQNTLSLTAYPFGTQTQGAIQTRLVDENLKWESTKSTDIGIDLSIRNGLFTLTADWFDKITNDILYEIQIPASVGLSSPTTNYASMKNTGFEFEVGHRNSFKDFSYGVSFNFTTYKNKVLKVAAPTFASEFTIQEGLPWKSFYLTEWIGIFQSDDDITKSPEHQYNPKPGDLKFKDQNGDGIIDADDRVVMDGAHPDFYYGGNINFSWKNFDISGFFQGVKGVKNIVNLWGFDPFQQGGAPTKEFAANAWTPQNQTNEYPAMYLADYLPVSGTASSYYLKDASYLRLKNLMLGYNAPSRIAERIGLSSLRVYISGDNLFTKTKYPGADPERSSENTRFSVWPQLRIFTAGVNLTF